MAENSKYKLEKIKSASDLEALIVIYDEIINRLERASAACAEGDGAACIRDIDWVIKAVNGLTSLLNFDADAVLAGNLYRIYEYLYRRLGVARSMIRQTAAILEESHKLISRLRESWVAVRDKGDVTEKFRVSSTSEERSFLNIEI